MIEVSDARHKQTGNRDKGQTQKLLLPGQNQTSGAKKAEMATCPLCFKHVLLPFFLHSFFSDLSFLYEERIRRLRLEFSSSYVCHLLSSTVLDQELFFYQHQILYQQIKKQNKTIPTSHLAQDLVYSEMLENDTIESCLNAVNAVCYRLNVCSPLPIHKLNPNTQCVSIRRGLSGGD